MSPALRLAGLGAHHGGLRVLRGVGLEVARGEAVAVLGRNGAGKTTLAHAILNLGPQLEGTVEVMGRDVRHWPTFRIARLGVALVPQGRGAFPGLSVQEVLRLPTLRRRAGNGGWTLSRVFDSFPALARHRGSAAQALSGGERQLLALGRALLSQPELLILDEPSEGLAPRLAEEILVGAMGLLVRDGMAVLLIEQNVALATRLCPRTVVLSGQSVGFDGPTEALLARPELIGAQLGLRPGG